MRLAPDERLFVQNYVSALVGVSHWTQARPDLVANENANPDDAWDAELTPDRRVFLVELLDQAGKEPFGWDFQTIVGWSPEYAHELRERLL